MKNSGCKVTILRNMDLEKFPVMVKFYPSGKSRTGSDVLRAVINRSKEYKNLCIWHLGSPGCFGQKNKVSYGLLSVVRLSLF